jgi:hypothetical protein
MPNAATLAAARAQWTDAGTLDDATLQQLLDASWSQCEAYLPAAIVAGFGTTPASTVPRYVLANIHAARDLWGAFRREGDLIGFETYAVRVRPLSDTVRALLRPPSALPGIG